MKTQKDGGEITEQQSNRPRATRRTTDRSAINKSRLRRTHFALTRIRCLGANSVAISYVVVRGDWGPLGTMSSRRLRRYPRRSRSRSRSRLLYRSGSSNVLGQLGNLVGRSFQAWSLPSRSRETGKTPRITRERTNNAEQSRLAELTRDATVR